MFTVVFRKGIQGSILIITIFAFVTTSLPQNHCMPKTDPSANKGGVGPGKFSFSFASDADDIEGKKTSWCYERVIINENPKTQLWVHWKDKFGDIMNLLIPPNSPQSVYEQNLEKPPVAISGSIDYGRWEDVKEGPPVLTDTWRSPEEAKRESSEPNRPTISGFEITPVSAAGETIALKIELQSDFDQRNKILTYRLINYDKSSPVIFYNDLENPANRDFPSIAWIAGDLLGFQTQLKKMGRPVVKPGTSLSITLTGIGGVSRRFGPLIIRSQGKIMFTGTASAYIPLPQ